MQRIATGFGLIEGPVWDSGRGLYFSDVANGGVHLLDQAGAVSPVIPKRRGIGGIALHASDGLVVGGRDIAFVRLADGNTRPLLSLDAIPGPTGFNDLTADGAGRIYVGSLAFRVFGGEEPKPGYLHVIDLDGKMRTLSDGILLTNGLGSAIGGPIKLAKDGGFTKTGILASAVPSALDQVNQFAVFYKNAGIDVNIQGVPLDVPDFAPNVQTLIDGGAQQISLIGDPSFCSSAISASAW